MFVIRKWHDIASAKTDFGGVHKRFRHWLVWCTMLAQS
jgi:hypothetical protein